MKLLIPSAPRPGVVTAVATKISPTPAFVMKIFDPLIRYPSPSRSARVRVPDASDPAPGSVRPNPPSTSPEARGGMNRRFCSSEPKLRIGESPSVVCAETVMEWLASNLPSSSTTRM